MKLCIYLILLSSCLSFRNIIALNPENDFCGTNDTEFRVRLRSSDSPVDSVKEINLKLLIFYDSALAFRQENNVTKINKWIMQIINGFHLIMNQKEFKNYMKGVNTHIIKIISLPKEPIDMNPLNQINDYLWKFCSWAKSKYNYLEWNLAIVLSGKNLWSINSSSAVQGMAQLGSVCRRYGDGYPCNIIEARTMKASWILAHEIGHNLGMHHDTYGKCNPDIHIMSETTGQGKTSWSSCSLDSIKEYFLSLTKTEWCFDPLLYEKPLMTFYQNETQPIFEVSLEQQCQFAFGMKSFAFTSNYPYYHVCNELWCQTEYLRLGAHPAMEGTVCAKGFRCNRGKCTSELLYNTK